MEPVALALGFAAALDAAVAGREHHAAFARIQTYRVATWADATLLQRLEMEPTHAA